MTSIDSVCRRSRAPLAAHAKPQRRWLRIRSFAVWATILTLPACFQSSAITYSADAIEARVVDADTGEPVSGVNIVAGWEVKGGMEGGNIIGWVKVMEAVTDGSGKFSFPAWGPIKWTKEGRVKSGSPLLIMFKSGYDRQVLDQRKRSSTEIAPAHMQSDWNGQTIKLQRFKGTFDEYSQRVADLDIEINSLLYNDECNWKAMPQFLHSIEVERRQLVANKAPRQPRSLPYLSQSYSRNCGDLQSYVLEFRK